MDQSAEPSRSFRNSTVARSPANQVVRAWILLLCGLGVFLALVIYTGTYTYSYILGSTEEQTATIEPVAGQSILIRSESEQDWRVVTDRTTVMEGDQISTGSVSVGWITMFDQSTIEVSENSLVRIQKMRTSRLFRERKEVVVEPVRGSIYVGMAPRGEFNTSVFRVNAGPATVSMRDEIRDVQTGSFLVETQRLDRTGGEEDSILNVRVAVLRGAATLETDRGSRTLSANEQVVVDPGGEHGDVTSAVRELIRNGDFAREMSDWVEFHDHSGDGSTESGQVERVPVQIGDDVRIAAQLSRSTSSGDNWETGIQQSIGQSLRVHSSINLSFELRIDEQRPLGGGGAMIEFPLIAKIDYVDVNGQDREWWHGFYIAEDPAEPVPDHIATRIARSEWTSVHMPIGNLDTLPRQISFVQFYSSGHNYRTLVTDISLTSSETGGEEYD
jgi:mannose-6-phosphate isomerase-like protein (cupin superfamily)